MSALAQLPRPVAFPVTVMHETVVVHVHLLDSTLHLGNGVAMSRRRRGNVDTTGRWTPVVTSLL